MVRSFAPGFEVNVRNLRLPFFLLDYFYAKLAILPVPRLDLIGYSKTLFNLFGFVKFTDARMRAIVNLEQFQIGFGWGGIVELNLFGLIIRVGLQLWMGAQKCMVEMLVGFGQPTFVVAPNDGSTSPCSPRS